LLGMEHNFDMVNLIFVLLDSKYAELTIIW
jgi:hypothetical protein